jgi:hypothetical protein
MAQVSWPNSKFDSLWYSGDILRDLPCRVRIGDGHIEVTYEDDGLVSYSGTEVGAGHFNLKRMDVAGEATLHMFPGTRIMDGYWVEGPSSGMWRISLA